MKKLSKVLSLVLVIAMVFSLCVIGASAKSFTDTDKVTANYKEAVDVVSDLGIIQGMTATTFDGQGTLTRAQACALIARMTLGVTTADNMTVSGVKFTDVPATFWGYKYVQYCANAGIVSGVGGNKFDPNANLTGYQFAKMLMAALGVDVSTCVGANWAITTAQLFYKLGFSNVVITNAPLAREAATQMVYDALFTSKSGGYGYPVYSGENQTGTVLGVFASLTDAAAAATAVKGSYGITKVTMGTDTLAKTVFGVTRNTKGEDLFKRPSTVYSVTTAAQAAAYGWGKTAAATKTIENAAVLTFTAGMTGVALKNAIINAGYKLPAAATVGGTALTYYTNGDVATALTDAQLASLMADTTNITGNGMLVEVFADSTTNTVSRITCVNTYLATVSASTKDVASTTTVDERTLTVAIAGSGRTYVADPTTPGFEAAYAAETAALATGKHATVLVTPNNDNTVPTIGGKANYAKTLAIPESKTVTPTSYTTGTSFVADGTTYTYSANKVGTVSSFTAQTVLVDAYGYVISAPGSTVTTKFAVVARTGAVTDTWTTRQVAELVMPDGSTQEVTTYADYKDLKQKVVSYTVNNDGQYVLVEANGSLGTPAVTYTGTPKGSTSGSPAVFTGVDLKITSGVATFNFDGSYVANNQTVFVVRSGLGTTASPYTYAAYTGVANVPSMTATGTAGGYIVTAGGVAKVVYITGASNATATTNDVVFVSSIVTESNTQTSTGASYTNYVASVVMNGEITTVNLAADYDIGVYLVKGTDAYGRVTLANKVGQALNKTSYDYVGGTLTNTVGGTATTYAVAANCVVYTVSANGAITTASLADITSTSTGWMTLNSDLSSTGIATVNAVYIIA